MSSSQSLFKVSYVLLFLGGPSSVGVLLWITLPTDNDLGGANIGGALLWFLATGLLLLGVILGLIAALMASANRRRSKAASPIPSWT